MAKIFRGTKGDLLFLAQRLRAGELVAVPSETVYGLAADALSAKACRGIFRAKDRPAADPLIVHVASIAQAGSIAELSEPARKLMRKFWPGPLTLVLPKKPAVPDVVTSGQPSVAVRMPGHPLFLKLLALTGTPLAAPSANPFGYVSPTTAQHVQDGLGKRIRYILDGGPCEVGVESTILDLRDPLRPRLLRPGKITKRELEKVLGRRVERSVPARLPLNASQSVGGAGCPQHAQRLTAFGAGKRTMPSGLGATRSTSGMIAPGMMVRHYSPHTPVVAHRRLSFKAARAGDPRDAFVFLRRPKAARALPNIFSWADSGDAQLSAVAHNLFALLRRLDAQRWRTIHVEFARAGGLGDAINDRLARAAAKARDLTP